MYPDLTHSLPTYFAIDDLTKFFLIIVFYVAPYVLIPAIIKRAGGMLGAITGVMNDKTKGIFDRQRQWRANKRKQLKEDAKKGARWGGNDAFSRFGRSAAKYASNFSGRNAGIGIDPRSWSARSIASNLRSTVGGTGTIDRVKQFLQSPEGQAAMADEAVARAGAGWTSEADTRQKLNAYEDQKFKAWYDAFGKPAGLKEEEEYRKQAAYRQTNVENHLNLIKRARREIGGQEYDIAAAISASGTSSGHTFDYVKNSETGEWEWVKMDGKTMRPDGKGVTNNAPQQMVQSIIDATGDDSMLRARVINEARSLASQKGRTALGGGSFGTTVGIAEAMAQGATEGIGDAFLKNLREGTHIQTAIYGKKSDFSTVVDAIISQIDSGVDGAELDRAYAKLAAFLDMAAGATGDNAAVLSKALQRTTKSGDTILGQIEVRRKNYKDHPEFNAQRKEITGGDTYFTGEKRSDGTTDQERAEAARRGGPPPPGTPSTTVPLTPGSSS